jgi:signal peptidase II
VSSSVIEGSVPSHDQRRVELAWGALVAVLILVADQATKALVVANIGLGERVEVIGDFAILWHVRNDGAAFSLFRGSQPFFYVVTVLALGMVAYFHRSLHGRGLWLHVLLGVILGGTLGNLVDRVRQGYVTDFVSVGIGDMRWPTWNVADASLVVGIIVLVVFLTFFERSRAEGGE